MRLAWPERKEKIGSAAAVAGLHLLLAWAFLTGLGYAPALAPPEVLKLFDTSEPPPPPKAVPAKPERRPVPRKARPKDPEGSAAPANLRNTPTEIVAPPPEIRLPVPPPLPAAPAAGEGSAAASGAAPVPGPGTGAGGQGTGLGSGLSGDGTGGGGGGGGRGVHARQIAGSIGEEDYPRRAYEAHVSGTVLIRFVVTPDGRVGDCAVTRSSGSAELDQTTCRLIRRRFRYRPARDAAGRPVAETIAGRQVWEVGPEPPPVDVEPDVPDDDPR
ncbi:MAG: TonB family protein [Alphaproteobacteria bacterium]|nr:TonB family protein [Alphaproteobacteria bacterium]MBV9373346.1 TonB family protein [Alphaproteobacteria bacterium]MBV9902613.1 TonB family protein [Alphaproteobacteria bacterium]